MAPELLGILRRQRTYTLAVDMWALGCLVHEILTGEVPFVDLPVETISDTGISAPEAGHRSTNILLMSQFCNGEAKLPTAALNVAGVRPSAIRFINNLLVADPKSRMSPVRAIQRSWITGGTPALSTPVDRCNE